MGGEAQFARSVAPGINAVIVLYQGQCPACADAHVRRHVGEGGGWRGRPLAEPSQQPGRLRQAAHGKRAIPAQRPVGMFQLVAGFQSWLFVDSQRGQYEAFAERGTLRVDGQ